jgi:transcriptional regulator with XRE-family HTH domain
MDRHQAGQRSGLTATYLGIIERGGNLPSLTVIFELCEVLNAHPADVIREVAAERFPGTPAQ